MRRLSTSSCLCLLALMACSEQRDREEPPAAFASVEPIVEERCVECHGGLVPAAEYSVEDYFETIGCIPSGQPATVPPDATAPILAVLERSDHAGLLNDSESASLTTWVTEGAWPARRASHPGQWMDPRTPAWHGTYLRETEWLPIIDPTRGDSCGLCHEGSPAPVPDITNVPPGATDCTVCHDLPGGVMACGTCHGDELRPFPPRNQCYFPGPPFGGAHSAHTEPSANMPNPLGCQACHFGRDNAMLGDGHGDGAVDVVFQPAWGPDATYDFETLACATTCHDRGGSAPDVAWDEALELDCGSCHSRLPPGHSDIACTGCHRGIDPQGDRLTVDAPHINGRVDAF